MFQLLDNFLVIVVYTYSYNAPWIEWIVLVTSNDITVNVSNWAYCVLDFEFVRIIGFIHCIHEKFEV